MPPLLPLLLLPLLPLLLLLPQLLLPPLLLPLLPLLLLPLLLLPLLPQGISSLGFVWDGGLCRTLPSLGGDSLAALPGKDGVCWGKGWERGATAADSEANLLDISQNQSPGLVLWPWTGDGKDKDSGEAGFEQDVPVTLATFFPLPAGHTGV